MVKVTSNKEIEDESLISVQPPPDVIAFNELRSCADLYRLYENKALEIQPPYQREVVWNPVEQSLFIDSLIKQLPIPSMCFSLDYKSQKWQVVDGLQRMTAIVSFLNQKKPWKIAQNEDIDPFIRGMTSFELRDGTDQQKILYSRVQNISLPITVIRCDPERADHSEYLFTIFHRLNYGGKKLNHQEIRNCIFSGTFNDHLRVLNEHKDWKTIRKLMSSRGLRFRTIELILRFFALHERVSKYGGNLPKFLNDYMRELRYAKPIILSRQEQLFKEVVSNIVRGIDTLPKFQLSYTLLEATMIGIAYNIGKVGTINSVALGQKILALSRSHELDSDAAKVGTTKASNVRDRVRKAREIFKA